MKRRAIFAIMAVLLLLASVALAQDTPDISWSVIGGGGRHVEAAPFALEGTVGQAIVGQISSVPYKNCAGFWCAWEGFQLSLPLVLKNY
jgi:hypothetical protein